jgi:hypothetical protein
MEVIRLSPLDNIVVVARRLEAGARILVDGAELALERPLGLGHKVAVCRIAAGEKVLKYGVSIGSATRDIEPGAHVHLHNMRSDYLPTYTIEEGRLFKDGT